MVMRRFEDIIDNLASYHTSANVALIQRAYMYSAKVHAGQVRKSGEPYLIHPLEVAYLLTRLRLDEASIATGLLHDTVEDTLTSLDDIRQMFGNEVVLLVDGITKLSQINFDTDEHKQAENFRKMLVAMAKDIRVILVKLADRLHNMRTLEHLPANKQRRIAQETIDIYAPLANRLGIHWIKGELEDLAFSYLHPEDYKSLELRMQQVTTARDDYVKEVVTTLQSMLEDVGVKSEVYGRPKHLYGIHRKMILRHIEFEQVYDVIAFRVIVDTVGQCYEVLGHVHALWHPIPGRFKDYIAMPKPNNYQSLHTSVIGPRAERIEIQIRTQNMHRIAEEGIAAHWQYKEKDAGKNEKLGVKGKQQYAWLRQLLEWQKDLKDPREFLDVVKYDLFTDEVFVFTPKGEVISLKRGSTPIDFAFAIHTQVGTHCSGAKVNGRMVPLRYELNNGDIVEIITHAQQRPSKDWLAFVRTGRAKAKIRSLVRSEERARSEVIGKELLEREFKKRGLSFQRAVKEGRLQEIAAHGKHHSLEGLFVALGYGHTTAAQIVDKLVPEKQKEPLTDKPTSILQIFKRSNRRSSGGVMVQGLDDVLVRFAKCCTPLPGESIIGFITRGRGIAVHSSRCTRAIDMDPARRIEVSWDTDEHFVRSVAIRVVTSDRQGLLATMTQILSDNGVNISLANCRVTGEDRAVHTFEIFVKDIEQLRKVVAQFKSIRGVLGVERL